MINHVTAILFGLGAVVLGNIAAIGGGIYVEYRFKIAEKVEPFVIAALATLKRK